MEPVKAGDQFPWLGDATRTIVAVRPYYGRYPQWFNVVLKLTSPQTRSGTIEMAYDDEALRPPGSASESA